ncbi:hypothetical protein DL93DRAFT_2234711 [Clavulina sp. PMI_390]|nr:hypothetical protein DL93DRAFT_2234711 [Clavulina sp. PMI_390]
MILEDAKAARSAGEQQEKHLEDVVNEDDNEIDEHARVLLAPPAYQRRSQAGPSSLPVPPRPDPTSPSYPGNVGHFAIDSMTSNALVFQTFKYAPINCDVLFDTRTTKSPASVALWRTMEGPFELSGE